ncbi:MAG: hypothetical protein IMX04_06175 [Candidatus Carbobacillus altaicus]|uniref:Uncharacterized protein n=1 Tax=Candidatus Carbonibacillus altaicus TaxID=2163959 RepID=A0A2R6XYY3_9BACL|nr:hypothetical protein [Candidatus Carbobacillus altaicus]PTQ55634.1 MAG: hypothetical protein BSOLF_1755 [Candidatus Carbobacillus altaicus]
MGGPAWANLTLPDIEVNVYWTSLEGDPWRVVELYREHATSEQFLECYQVGPRLRTVTVREISDE